MTTEHIAMKEKVHPAKEEKSRGHKPVDGAGGGWQAEGGLEPSLCRASGPLRQLCCPWRQHLRGLWPRSSSECLRISHTVSQPYLRSRPPNPQPLLTSWGTSSPKSASIRNILAIFSHGPCRILETSGYSQSFNFVLSGGGEGARKKGGLQNLGRGALGLPFFIPG